MMERDALGRPRKNLWVAHREELKPDLPKLPSLEGPAPESKVLYDSGWEDGIGKFLESGEPMAKGFNRFVQYVKEQRAEGRADKDILGTAARFVHLYPASVAGTTAEFAAGLRAGLQAFRKQVEEGELDIAADRVSKTPSAQEVEAARQERSAARAAKKAAKEAEARSAARSAAARKAAKARAKAKPAARKAGTKAPKAARPAKSAGGSRAAQSRKGRRK